MPAFLVAVVASAVLLFSPSAPGTGPFEGSDKVVHALIFLTLAALGRRAGLPVGGLALGLVLYAVGSELLQSLEAERTASATDALADATGLTAGLLLYVAWRRRAVR